MDEKDIFLKKFESKLKEKLDPNTLNKLSGGEDFDDDLKSTDYDKFRKENLSLNASFYEKYCNFCEKIFPINSSDKKISKEIEFNLFQAHIHTTVTGVMSATVFTALILLLFGFLVFLFNATIGIGILIVAASSYFVMQSLPLMFRNRTRTKASNEIIIAIFYMVAFMRFSPNFELAVNFAAKYLSGPLSLDFKRILWDLNNAKFPTIKAAFDDYLEGWRDDNLEFLESVYLIESSLYESDEARRISLLDKSLDIILQGNYEKVLHYAQELRGKVSTFNMIGVVMPILGLIILPLAASFGDPKGTLDVVFVLYNILFPLGVVFYAIIILFDRPGSINSIKPPQNIDLKKLERVPIHLSKDKIMYFPPWVPALSIFLFLFLIGIFPILIHNMGTIAEDSCSSSVELNLNSMLSGIPTTGFNTFQEYKYLSKDGGSSYCYGPYGSYPGLFSIFFPLSFAFGIGYFLRYKYRNLIALRDGTKKLELQFPSATFQ